MLNIDVSIVMATFNDSVDYLKMAIDSIIKQTYKKWELIIVDDSINEDTIKCLQKYCESDSRIKFIHNEKRLGFVASLNKGIRLSRGKYIGRMDGDDYSYPTRIEKEYVFLEANSEYSVVGSIINIIDENNNITSQIKFAEKGLRFRLFGMFRCPIQHGDILMRRNAINIENCYDEKFKKAEDLELWLRLMKQGRKLYNLRETLFSFRIESNYAEKRSREHFSYNLKARIKNFSWNHPFTSVGGVIISFTYKNMPLWIKNIIYGKLNKSRV